MNKDSFVLYNSFYEPIKTLKNEQLGKLLRAIFNYTTNGEITQDSDILVAFMFIKNQLDIDSKKWEDEKKKRSEAGKKGMASRWNNKDNSVITNHNKDNNVINTITKITDNVNVNDNDNVIKKEIYKERKEKPKKEKYGTYGRIKLTIDEYLKLVNDFGEDFIKKQIDLLDEYVEGNNNKNKYTNFNLVLRKSIRENWFKKNKEESNNIFLDIMKDDYGR